MKADRLFGIGFLAFLMVAAAVFAYHYWWSVFISIPIFLAIWTDMAVMISQEQRGPKEVWVYLFRGR